MFTLHLRAAPPPAQPVLPWEERRALRRGPPEPLRFDAPGMPLFVLPPEPDPEPVRAPSGLRLRLGLLLIAWGRRLSEA